jgi:transcriptional regulator with XRE-family HTH domain
VNVEGRLVKRIRKKGKLNQVDLAKKMGISQSCLSKIEKGSLDLNAGSLLAMRESYGLDINKLMDITIRLKRRTKTQ